MKKFLKPIYAGINGKLDKESGKYKFKVDFDNNTDDDVIKFIEPYFHESSIDQYTYWFGYSFNDGQSNPRRDEFIKFIKHVQPENWSDPDDEWSDPIYNDDSITELDLQRMIFNSMNKIRLDERDIDTVIYPESHSGNLVSMIVKILQRAMPSKPYLKTEKVLKSDPKQINFDWESFHNDIENGNIHVPSFVTDEYIQDMMEEVNSLDNFSLRKNIHPVSLRPYVSGFYSLDAVQTTLANSDVVLIVDDFGTSGTTIRELIRIVRAVNSHCEIYIFTLMGNKRKK